MNNKNCTQKKNLDCLRFLIMYNGAFLRDDGRFTSDLSDPKILVANTDIVRPYQSSEDSIENFLNGFSIALPLEITEDADRLKFVWFDYNKMYGTTNCLKSSPEQPLKRTREFIATYC